VSDHIDSDHIDSDHSGSDHDSTGTTPRLKEFRAEVEGIGVTGGGANPERTGTVAGLVLLVLGLVVALVAALSQRGESSAGDANAMLAEVVTSNNGTIVVVLGLSLAIVGGLIWVRNSLTRYFRYWLVRLIYEDRSNTDRLIEAIREANDGDSGSD